MVVSAQALIPQPASVVWCKRIPERTAQVDRPFAEAGAKAFSAREVCPATPLWLYGAGDDATREMPRS